jgi:hypothetical protein
MTAKNVTMGDGAWFLCKLGVAMLAVSACVAIALALLPVLSVLRCMP